MPNIAIDSAVLSPNVTIVRWKAHQDWVTQVTFYRSVSVHTSLTKKYIYIQALTQNICRGLGTIHMFAL